MILGNLAADSVWKGGGRAGALAEGKGAASRAATRASVVVSSASFSEGRAQPRTNASAAASERASSGRSATTLPMWPVAAMTA